MVTLGPAHRRGAAAQPQALGCAIQPAIDTAIADQIRHAQIALKRAKQTDRIEIYEPEAAILSDNRFGLETALRNALEMPTRASRPTAWR